jgi:hypothetical protein
MGNIDPRICSLGLQFIEGKILISNTTELSN